MYNTNNMQTRITNSSKKKKKKKQKHKIQLFYAGLTDFGC